ncbi:MAG: polyprenyl synthetase family protein [Candidatus Omnitrophica bacterium]|nr:polyprenyl synthetase family protein [Candidatus Omnitrophota bacterium]
MSPTTRLRQRQRWVESALRRALRLDAGSPVLLGRAIRYCVFSEGKRFRPLLCLGGCEAAGGRARQALPVACAVELIHTYSLVHDDLPAMDNADQRRGRPSCHRRFGEATAILVGDALLTRAFELLGTPGVANTAAILRALGSAGGAAGLVGGQLMDLAENGYQSPAAKRLEEIARRKTAALITGSVVSGALAAEAKAPVVGRLRRYGEALGLAFQLIDDVHDHDGLVTLAPAEQVRRRALGLIDQAKRSIIALGQRASTLLDLADWLASTSEHVSSVG